MLYLNNDIILKYERNFKYQLKDSYLKNYLKISGHLKNNKDEIYMNLIKTHETCKDPGVI